MEVLKFSGRQVHAKALRAELDPRSSEDLASARLKEYPTAYVIRNRDLEELRRVDGLVDRGRKHKAMELSRLLLGQDRIPFVRGSYTDSRQLVRSVRSLLANAVKRNDRNIYVIGTDADLFKKLWVAAGEAGKKREDTIGSLARIVPCEEVLNLLAHTEVPPELEQRFVGTSRAAQLIRRLIMRAASTSEEVLILGDTGTGKEVVARCIHDYSGREPFVQVS